LTLAYPLILFVIRHPGRTTRDETGDRRMGANHAGERKRRKLKNTKKILRTQTKKAQVKGK
jgi:hypothetical protein